MLEHCNRTFRAEEIWFLRSNNNFTNRKLEIGKCPDCNKQIVLLAEKRLIDSKNFKTILSGKKANKIINECRNEIEYTSLDILNVKGQPFGFKYGENKEVRDKRTGKVTKIEKACDFYGNKEVIRKTETYL